jgi:ABC-type polysaccharide/polyol phosphate transport system ATPase subunit
MSERVVIEFEQVGKMYRLYKSRLQSFLDATSLGQFVPRWNTGIDNFWALRNVSFKLEAGSRLGIIGRNGAGKTTLLKLMTGNLTPTEGQIAVRGDVQALLEAGAGFHPEFSGFENIEASLIQNGFSRAQIKAAIDEIADFTELGDFLRQPFKTYSAGMQARLVFTTATAVQPDILIIDEILGAGDAYFAVKSRARMKELVEGGASVLLVSHALDQILQFCEEAIWLERGRIVLRGPSMEVVKAYEEFVHNLQDRQLKAANRQRKLGFRDAVEIGHFADYFVVALSLTGAPGARSDIGRIEQRCEDLAEEVLRVGDPQDSDQTHLSYVALNTGDWGDPEIEVDGAFRSLTRTEGAANPTLGETVFRSYALEPGKRYAFRICYRITGEGQLTATVSRNGQAIVVDEMLPIDGAAWQVHDLVLPLALIDDADAIAAPEDAISVAALADKRAPRGLAQSAAGSKEEAANAAVLKVEGAAENSRGRVMAARRWPGESTLLIDDVVLQAADGSERAVLTVGSALTIRVFYRARQTGEFPILCSIVIYRVDGIVVTQHVSPREFLDLSAGDRREVQLKFPSLDLADGRYVISVALHRELDPQAPNATVRYDLLDRSYEFEVVGNPPLRTSLFVLPARWIPAAQGVREERPD